MKSTDRYHKWVEWSDDDATYIGRCPDLMTGIHGDDPLRLYTQLCETVEEVVRHYESQSRPLPAPRVRPMREIA